MAIEYETRLHDGTLYVRTWGRDEGLEEAQAYALGVLNEANEKQARRVLLDERELEYRLDTIDTYALAEKTACAAPSLARVALVANAAQLSDAQFWETVTTNRGFQARVFVDMSEAAAWLGVAMPDGFGQSEIEGSAS